MTSRTGRDILCVGQGGQVLTADGGHPGGIVVTATGTAAGRPYGATESIDVVLTPDAARRLGAMLLHLTDQTTTENGDTE